MEHTWKRMSAGALNFAGAVPGGHDKNGSRIYVGRAVHNGELIPGKVVPNCGGAYISYGGLEHQKGDFEVLFERPDRWYSWASEHEGGHVPSHAVIGSLTNNGDPLYIGRAWHNNTLCVGKIHPSEGCLFIPYHHKEHEYKKYEVLVSWSRN